MLICPECKYRTDRNVKFCGIDGTPMIPYTERHCPHCGATSRFAADKFCEQCAAKLPDLVEVGGKS